MATLLLVPLAACSGRGVVQEAPQPVSGQPQSVRQVAVTANVRVTVDDLVAASERVTELTSGAGGFIESSRTRPGDRVDLEVRLPAESLDETLGQVRALGEVNGESVTTTDLTDQVVDFDARLQNLIAVRDRLRGYLERASSVDDVIAVERELTRVQSEIDRLSGVLEGLRSDVALSRLSLSLHRRRTLGPLGAIGYGVVWALRKLVFLN